MSETAMLTCTKCKRTRPAKYIVIRKTYNGKRARCRARSVCSSIARRRLAGRAKTVV